MKYIQLFFIASFTFFLLTGCSKEKEKERETTNSFSGTVREAGSAIALSDVKVELSPSSGRKISELTDDKGKYLFEAVKSDKYSLSFTKTGYENFTVEITVGDGKGESISSYDAVLKKIKEEPVSVTLDYLALSDGFFYNFSMSSNTKEFYWHCFETSELPQKEDDIITKVLAEGMLVTKNQIVEKWSFWSQNFAENTNYTFCIIPYDTQEKREELYKIQLTTKSSDDAPEAKINIREIYDETVIYDITRNSYCGKYIECGWFDITEESVYLSDVYWAGITYFTVKDNNDYIQNQDLFENEWSDWPENSLNMIVTLGYDKSGNVSGVINKEVFSTATNEVLSLKSSTANSNKSSCASVNNNRYKMRHLSPKSSR